MAFTQLGKFSSEQDMAGLLLRLENLEASQLQLLATTAGGLFVATGSGAVAERNYGYKMGDLSYTGAGAGDNTYASYTTAAWGSGTNVGVSVVTGNTALILHGFAFVSGTALDVNISQSYAVTGATTIAAADAWRLLSSIAGAGYEGSGGMRLHLRTDLTPGTNTFQLQAKATDISTALVARPYIFVLPL